MNKIKYTFLFKNFCAFIFFCSLSSFAWETKEAFDKDFIESVSQFLKKRDQKYIFVKNFYDFVTTHIPLLKEYNKFCTYDPDDPNKPWSGIMKEMESFSGTGFNEYDTFFCVGPQKPLSNLPTHTLIHSEEIKSAIENWAAQIGYETYTSADLGKPGAMWVFDPNALTRLLNTNSALLKEHNVSENPIEFIKEISKRGDDNRAPFELGKGKNRMFQLIARAFGREISLEDIEKWDALNK